MRYELTIRQAAQRAGVSTSTIAQHIKSGNLKARRFRRRIKINTEEFRRWFALWQSGQLKPKRNAKQRLTIEENEWEAQRQAQEKALRRALDDGDDEAAQIIGKALAATLAEIANN